jgi:serine/threonine-protein kinase
MGLPVDGRSDLFSAGVILYQFLTGERPFAGSSNTTMQKVLKEDPLPPSTLNVQLPPAIDAVVRKALAKRAEDRFQTAAEFTAALHDALAEPLAGEATALAGTDATRRYVPGGAPPARGGEATMPNLATPAAAPTIAPPSPPPPMRAPSSQRTAIAIVAAVAVIGIAALAATWWLLPHGDTKALQASGAIATGSTQQAASAPPASPATTQTSAQQASAAVAAAAPADAPSVDASAAPPGKLVVTAMGLVDPGDPRYAHDQALLATDVKADSRAQLVAKALAAMLDRDSYMQNYDLLRDRVLSQSGSYINATVQEGAPRVGKDGLMSVTTQAVVDVKALQKSLDELSRDERVQLIRANGDPRVSLHIGVRDAEQPDAPAQPSPIAENVLKERIQSFGFRTWSDEATPPGAKGPDFAVTGEANVKKLSMKLAASGLVVHKYTLASWTVKCTDLATGEEIYFNTTLPKAIGSWASQEEALRAIGAGVADQFSRDFFLRHVPVRGRKVKLIVSGMPDVASEEVLARELIGLPAIINASAAAPAKPRTYDLQVAPGAGSDAIAKDVVGPLNAKLGESCFAISSSEVARVTVAFDARCAEGLARNRLETNPPAGLYGAPPARQKAVIKNPEVLRKLVV